MKTRTITITASFVAEVPADMDNDEIQDIALDVSEIKIRTFASPVQGSRVLSYETVSIEPNELA